MNWRLQLKHRFFLKKRGLKDVATSSSDLKSKKGSNYLDMSGLTALIFLLRANLPRAARIFSRKDGEEIRDFHLQFREPPGFGAVSVMDALFLKFASGLRGA